MILRIVMVTVLALALPACSGPKDLKSPCVGTDDSPCGPRRPVNAG